jgi:hypothetical protein
MDSDDLVELEALEREVEVLARQKAVRQKRRELIANSVTDAVKELIMSILRVIDELSFLGKVFGSKKKGKEPSKEGGSQHE